MLTLLKRKLHLEKDGREWLLDMMPKQAVCAEIGVFWGDFSRLILKRTQPKELHLIDPWEAFTDAGLKPKYARANPEQAQMDAIYERVCRKFDRPDVHIYRAHSQQIANVFSDQFFDWIYLDGDHRYEGVMGDLHAFHSKMKPGGLVAGDDYARPKNNWAQDGVTRAVERILEMGLYEAVVLSPETHQFILRKPHQRAIESL